MPSSSGPSLPVALRARRRKRLLLALAVLDAVLWAWVGVLSWIPGQVREAVEARLAGSGMQVQWQRLSLSAFGNVAVEGLAIGEGLRPLLAVERLEVSISALDVLLGRRRAEHIVLVKPVVYLDLIDGKPLFWQKLADALRKKKSDEPRQPKTPGPKGLGRYTQSLEIREGQLQVGILGNAAWLFGPKLEITAVEALLEVESGGSLGLVLPKQLGGGKLAAEFRSDGSKLTAASGDFTPPLRWRVPGKDEKRPKGLHVTVAGLGWLADAPALKAVALADAATTLIALDQVGVDAEDKALVVAGLHVSVPERVWKPYAPANLPGEVTALLANVSLDAGQVRLRKAGETTEAEVVAIHSALGGLPVQVAKLLVQRTDKSTVLAVDGPLLQVPLSAPAVPQAVRTRVAEISAVRRAAPPEAEPEEDDDDGEAALDPDAPLPAPGVGAGPLAAPAQGALAVAPKGPRKPPAPEWMAALRDGQRAALGVRARLDALWPLQKLPEYLRSGAMQLHVRGARAELLGDDGRVVLGVRDGEVELEQAPGTTLPRLSVRLQPWDSYGTLGRVGVAWWKDGADQHVLDVGLSGGGIAQLLASRLPGAAIGPGASVGVWLRTTVAADKTVRVAGRFDVAKLGIQWWRLAERPIADFALAGALEATIRPAGRWTLLMDELQLGDARMIAEADFAQVMDRPRVHLSLAAPLQDCGAMLQAIPPSMTPTIGRIEANGLMGWSVGLDTNLPNVGATAVELALSDTLCTVERLGDIDFAEFQNKKWSRPVNENGKILTDVLIGPGSGSWTPLARMPAFLPFVMWSSEDSFYKHRGISESLLAKALAIDLSHGRFIYGGSTITQQLVKNLYLKRTKALSRKFEEMLIVWQMERVLGKHKILEIYLNGVEFGPKVYGITRAAWDFFQKPPGALRPKEATYLAIIKPSPRSGWGTARGNGWGEWYEMKTGKYMDKLLFEGLISQEDYDLDRAEFGSWKPNFRPAARGSAAPK